MLRSRALAVDFDFSQRLNIHLAQHGAVTTAIVKEQMMPPGLCI
jgi:hypothetical protein